MSRRAALVEEEFDDDTDLPLPSQPLPNTGTRGAILERLDDDEDDDEDGAPMLRGPTAGPASPSLPQFRGADGAHQVTDITPYKKWTCIYPIYIDAKRPCGRGERRIARAKSVWWPLSKDIADATNRLGLGTLHEVHKAHPRDWENPGRVRVQWKKDGKLVNPAIKSKKQLLEMISVQIQMLKPDTIPKPPYGTDLVPQAEEPPAPATPVKGKQPAPAKKSASVSNTTISPSPAGLKRRQKVPSPPQPWPQLTSRVSPYSPALPSGVLIDTVKAGMTAQEAAPAAGGAAAGGKGKRKVIRVRG
ncbi:signal recognition particle SRP19 subunit [Epithele typhae]|uniref:signal recognition particle SRP19 subunit n=1 Tax=Epithele typhae TaxID=378194 RepID=UPI002007F4E4|nr:signal recognition particle SRP19 subunit [Epithele typhae]KAH9941089.1 signal recognition particle SRP19 subunit [Epithele typhae]